MASMSHFKINKALLKLWVMLLVWLLILAWRLFISVSDIHRQSTVWIEFGYLIALYGYIHITVLGLGRMLVRRFNLSLSKTESTLLAYMLGLGALSIVFMLIGLVGWLNSMGIFICLAISGCVASFELYKIVLDDWSAIWRLSRNNNVYEMLLKIFIMAMIPILLVHAFTPVWDYDALLYHLEIPRQFLAHGRIYFDPEIMRSAYPLLGEMLFVVGMAFQLDSLSKLINLTYAFLFVLSTFTFAKRFFNREVGLVAVGILISAPAFILWATWASIDFAWACYELWSIYAVALWLANEKTDTEKWLRLAGIMSGFAASTKYISIPSLLIVAVIITWMSMQRSKQRIVEAIRNLLTFGLSAGLVMGAWYIKNWIWTGNPVYPLVFGGPGWGPLENQILQDYMQTFGVGKSWLDYLLLPYNVYAHHDQFSTIQQEIIHPLLWLAFLFPFVVKYQKYAAIIIYAALYYIWWLFGSQVIRFLLPPSAFLVILAGSVIERLPLFIKNSLKLLVIIGLMTFNLVYQFLVLNNSGAFSYLAGQKSKAEFLGLFADDFRVKQYIQETLDPAERVLFLWDGRGYYCDSRCIPDNAQSAAVGLAVGSPLPQELAHSLRLDGVTYVMLSHTDVDWFIKYHDPHEYHRNALHYYESIFLPVCGKSVYEGDGMELFKVTCR